MPKINRLPDPCPDHPHSRAYFTRSLTPNCVTLSQYRIRQHLCAEDACANPLGWIYEDPQETISGAGLCPQQFVDTVLAEKLRYETVDLWCKYGLLSVITLMIAYFLTLSLTDQTWTSIHSVGMSITGALLIVPGKIIHSIIKNRKPTSAPSFHEESSG